MTAAYETGAGSGRQGRREGGTDLQCELEVGDVVGSDGEWRRFLLDHLKKRGERGEERREEEGGRRG